MLSDRFRLPAFLLALVLLVSSLTSTATAQVQATFNVLAFYSGTWDAAHIDFEKEANQRFPQFGAQNGFTYTATNNWDQLNNLTASQYQVVMFLDDSPHTDAQRTGFQRYMRQRWRVLRLPRRGVQRRERRLAVVQQHAARDRPVPVEHLGTDRGHAEGGEPFAPGAGEHPARRSGRR